MGIKVKVQGGTARSDERSLCYTCKRAAVIQGETLREEIIVCGAMGGANDRIRFKVTQCNVFIPMNQPSIRDMEETAWVLRTDNRTRQIGFVPSKKLKREERYILEDDRLDY